MADLKNVQWSVGDIVTMKKPHACKENQWQITRVGMDFRLKCLGCGRYIMLTRQDFKKRVKSIIEKAESVGSGVE